MRYTYSRWDHSQQAAIFDPDELMDALSDDLLSDGDLWNAMQRVIRWGLQQDGQQRSPGLQWLLQRLRAQRQQELERYNLGGMMDGIREQLDNIVAREREGIERRNRAAEAQPDEDLRESVRGIAQRKEHFLQELPDEPGPALSALAEYEFLDEQARARFDGLLDELQEQVLQAHFRHMQQSLQGMAGARLDELKDMLRDMTRLLREQLETGDADFERFRGEHGRFFPGITSLDELLNELRDQIQAMDTLVNSMTPEMRRSLDSLVEAAMRDDEVRQHLGEVAEALEQLAPPRTVRADYPFSGTTSLTLEEALRLMRRMHDLDQLEHDIKHAQETGNLDSLDALAVQELMGEEAFQALDHLQRLTDVLQDAGYVERKDGAVELTARGIRKIGQKALQDIFQHLKRDAFGRHAAPLAGAGGDRSDDHKVYEFGDAFLLDMQATLMNAVLRSGGGSPLRLAVSDFEVFQTEYLTRSSTVLLLDMSRSMPLRGCFVAAKKVAFALNSLIRTQFPRDRLYIVGFSDYARVLRPETLHQITWGDYVYGTNMQHGFILARRLLGRDRASNKQIILITDGEPTAHFEGDRVQFSYPPTFRTFQETLREVKRCTQEGIVINTFMLERSHYLADFVKQMTRINRGRAFFATPERLGDYILVDYVASKNSLAATSVVSA